MIKKNVLLIMRFARYLAPHRWLWISTAALAGIYTLLGLIMPFLIKLAVDRGLEQKDAKSFIFFGICAGIVFVLGELIEVFRQFVAENLKNKFAFALRKDALQHLYSLGVLYFKNRTTGEHLYKFNYDIDMVIEFITSSIPQLLFIVPRAILIFIIICFLDLKMAVFCVGFIALTIILPYRLNAVMQKMWERFVGLSEETYKHLDEIFSHMLLVKVFGKENTALQSYLERFNAAVAERMRNLKLEMAVAFTGSVLSKVLIGVIAVLGGYQVMRGNLMLGSLAAVMAYLYQLGSLERELFGCLHIAAAGIVSCRRVDGLFNQEVTVTDTPQAKDLHFTKGEILFEGVSFGYQPGQNVLKNINIRFEGGDHVALVGASGCGKTTLVNMIVRLFDPLEGRITIDGFDVRAVKLSSLKQQIGFVLQEPHLWNDTVKNNIAYGSDNAVLDDIFCAAKAACVDEFAASLENGYNTVIGENACRISEGQKQKIAIARALVKRPKILIIDEAFSSVDSAGEERILSSLKRHYAGMTLIIISHRFSNVMTADKVIYFSPLGYLVEGTARDISQREKSFEALFAGQARICGDGS